MPQDKRCHQMRFPLYVPALQMPCKPLRASVSSLILTLVLSLIHISGTAQTLAEGFYRCMAEE